MILKEIKDNIVVSAVQIISFDIEINDDKKAVISVVRDDVQSTQSTYTQAPGDHHIYHIVDDNNNIIRLIHQ